MNADVSTDFKWLCDHSLELYDQYKGKWIAVHDGEVIGVGDTAVEAAARAEANRPGVRFILEAIDEEIDTVYACL